MNRAFPDRLKFAPVVYEGMNDWFADRGYDTVQFLYRGDGVGDPPGQVFFWLLLPGNNRGYLYVDKRKSANDGFWIGNEFKPYSIVEWGIMDCD